VTNGRGDGVETRVIEGHNVGRVLVDAARDATMLVVGMNHRHGLGYFLGSTATNCVRHAISPVMVVPENWHSTSSDVVPRTEVVRA
jgi:nucleotide-binding universal stress UspA family protein